MSNDLTHPVESQALLRPESASLVKYYRHRRRAWRPRCRTHARTSRPPRHRRRRRTCDRRDRRGDPGDAESVASAHPLGAGEAAGGYLRRAEGCGVEEM